MIIKRTSTRKGLACFFLTLLTVQGLMPTVAWALTSGPSQPETKQFVQAGTSDMVDLATGNFKYNIPLLDVDGYPLNLNYQSGTGIEDEASWVGLGWNLNPGAINRQLRGIADDSNGDVVTTETYMKPKITAGGSGTVRGELFGTGITGSVSVGIFSDNYTGIGAEIGVNAGLSLSKANGTYLSPGLNVGLSSSTASGVSVTPSVSLSLAKTENDKKSSSMNVSASLGYNSREGLKTLSYKAAYTPLSYDFDLSLSVNYNTPPFYPKTNIPFTSSNFTARLDLGGTAAGAFEAIGATGYKTVREISTPVQQNRAYGFMYAERGKSQPDAMMDFMREKDNPIIPELQNLALPIVTPDIFSYTSQAGSGQLKLFRNGTGVFFDNETNDVSDNKSLSGELGTGGYYHGGVSIFNQDIKTTNGKWTIDNDFLAKGDFLDRDSVIEENAYFKEVGEKNVEDQGYVDRILTERPVSIPLSSKKALGQLKQGNNVGANPMIPVKPYYKKTGRQSKRNPIMALTAAQATNAGLDKRIKNYPFYTYSATAPFTPVACFKSPATIARMDAMKKPDHLSEITVTGDDGKRMVYGIPVYNRVQNEYSFAVDGSSADKVNNLIKYKVNSGGTIDHKPLRNGKSTTDEYYHKETQPAYAASYLLTGILSPDYVDATGDGITEDDRGTAIKFNYTRMHDWYKWRAPYGDTLANYNRGLNADPDDDKASFVYGEKEIWYPSSIESRTKIAYFITEDREDGLACDLQGNRLIGTNFGSAPILALVGPRQRRLKEIRLYSKGDLTTPIKTVVFEYNYELCPGIPNSINGGGKLTLTKVYFKYASSSRGQNNPYQFTYDNNPAYTRMSSDGWGTYKPVGNNAADSFPGFKNDEFPYATRDSATAAQNVSAWQLSAITLPTGGKINVTYEGDDYAYVQNKRAMQMVKFTGMLDNGGTITTSLRDAKWFKLPLSDSPPIGTTSITSWFKDKYLNGEPYMYSRFYVNVTDEPTSTDESKYDFVPGYGAIDSVYLQDATAIISFKPDNDGGVKVNPFISIAWQRMRFDYPRYAYPGYKNKIDDDRPVSAVVTALANSVKNISELWENFNKRAYRKKFAANVNMDKSFTRVVKRNGVKLGGGLRVKKIMLSDEWNRMASDQSASSYGQAYEYNMMQDGQRISSGVAAYEPALGGDVNPMRLPVTYTQDVKWGLNNYFYLEEPMGESLYPSPEVSYREVRVRNLNASGNIDDSYKTGWNTYEFYTAKEFPVVVQQTGMDTYRHNPNSWSSFFGGKSTYELALSQGYAIFLNDMQGKPKAERVFNQSGQEISSSEYFYNATEEGGIQRLKNVVDVVDNTGAITKNQVIGREVEMFADMRQSEMSNTGKTINIGIDVIPIPFLPGSFPAPHFPWSENDDYRLFRSASVVKTIQYYGVVSKVVKKINGSSITAANLLYDKLTGEPVLTQSNNEFDDPIYSVNVPAYWMYKQMGPAYQTLGLVLKNFKINNGVISPEYVGSLTAGDELVNTATGDLRWVISSPTGTIRIIDKSGRVVKNESSDLIVRRSGYRNLLTAGATAITSLKNPVSNNLLKVFSNEELASFKILNASAIEYHEAWGQPADCNLKSCPPGYVEDVNGNCYLPAVPSPSDSFDIIDGDKYVDYSTHGALFFSQSGAGQPSDNSSTAAFWMNSCGVSCGRLGEAGVWMKSNQDGAWWGFKKCINITTAKDYYIGYGGDDLMTVYLDGVVLDQLSDAANSNQHFEYWRVRRVTLSAGKHTIQVGVVNATGAKAVALEVYNTTLDTLVAGNESAIRRATIFSTADFKTKGDHNVLVFNTTATGVINERNYICGSGTLSICDGSPNCGFKPKGSCPDGYVPSADGMGCVPIGGGEDTSRLLNIAEADHLAEYSSQGAILHNADGSEGARLTAPFWGGLNCSIINTRTSAKIARNIAVSATNAPVQGTDTISRFAPRALSVQSSSSNSFCGRLNYAGFWLQGGFDDNNQWIGVNTCLKIPESKVYYIGFGADNDIRLYIDGNLLPYSTSYTGSDIFLDWKLYPQFLTAGNHILTIEAANDNPTTHKAVAVEVYDKTPAELQAGIGIVPIYSTVNLMDGKPYDTYVKDVNGVVIKKRFNCPGGNVDVCGDVVGCPAISNGTVLNPYLTGYLGNWLPWKQMVWLSDRSGQSLTSTPSATPDIRNNGHLTSFMAYWTYNNGWNISTNTNWVTSTTTTIYDQFSQEQETKDALGRYSSARYGYKSTLPVAVGANMRQREIFYDGFDDYKFNNLCMDSLPCQPDGFNIYKILGTGYATRLNATDSHSGNYSLTLNGSLLLSTYVFANEHAPGIYLGNNGDGEYYRNPAAWLGLRGFCPVKGRKYVFSVWEKDKNPSSPTPGVSLKVNDILITNLTTKASIEGWKLVEAVLDIPTLANGNSEMVPLSVILTGGANVLIDDIRIFPYDGQLKTFTYDEKTLWLMAEMDENNYATFYEYDDEGSLIRVKKETERGIMTIKENRSAYRKNTTP
jgi:hypothetical protein